METPRAFKGMQSVEKEKEEKDGGGKKLLDDEREYDRNVFSFYIDTQLE